MDSNVDDLTNLEDTLVFCQWVDEDEVMTLLFDTVDGALMAPDGHLAVDTFLGALNVERLNTTLLIGILTVTNAAKARLPSRQALVERIRDRLEVVASGRAMRLLSGF